MMPRTYTTGFSRGLGWLCAIALMARLVANAVDYLPDAATHLGTVFINSDDQFTTNAAVMLTIAATNTGSGISQMQFSNDDQTWSAREPFAATKAWTLPVSAEDYPTNMNTVLKTVYVRVQCGDGTWSKAFSDGIVFAKSPLDVPLIKEIWIRQQRPTPYSASAPLGSQLNPYIVTAGANEVAFDTLMRTLATNYSSYRAKPGAFDLEPQPMNLTEVLFLHIGPGTYETHGDFGGRPTSLSWSPTAGTRIKGAGKDATILKLVGGNTNAFAHVIGNYGGAGLGVYDNTEISDLTVDANMHEGGNKTSSWVRTGVTLAGNNTQLRRLRVKGFGSRVPGLEPGGMTGFNAGSGNVHNFHIEDCEVIAPQSINSYTPLMIGYQGGGRDTHSNALYMVNVVIRNNFVNGAMYDQALPLNPYTNSFMERASHGITLGGCKNGIIEDNFIVHVLSGYYNDTFDLNDVLVRNNHFRDVIGGLNFGTGAAQSLRFEGNLVELDPHYYTTPVTGGSGPSDYGWRMGVILHEPLRAPINLTIIQSNIFQFNDRLTPTNPLVGSIGIASLSGSADFENNSLFGLTHAPIRWYQWEGPPITFFDQQADILDPAKPPPITLANNHHNDGTIMEVYPYVLDRTLPRPVVVPGATISFPAPLINGATPGLVTGLPATNVLDGFGNFSWTPTMSDVGNYIVSFYDSTNRTQDPRHTLITVQSGLNETSPSYYLTGLAGYWRLGENSAATLTDSSGNGHHIAVSGSAQNYLIPGTPGHRPGQKALRFKNTNPVKNSTFALPNIGQLLGDFPLAYHPYLARGTQLARPFTVSYWFKPDHQPTNIEVIVDVGSLVFCGVGPTTTPTTNLARVFCDNATSPDLAAYGSLHPQNVNVTIGEWHHLVFVYEGIATKIYLDGSQQAEMPCGQIEDFNGSRGLGFGGGWGGNNYLGSLSDLAIWNRPLSAVEIARVYTSQKDDSIFPGLTRPPPVQNMRIVH